MNKLGIEKAHLMGQSMGSGTSINFTVQHPHRLNKLVLTTAVGMPNLLPLTAKVFNLPEVGESLMKILKKNLFVYNEQILFAFGWRRTFSRPFD